MRILHIITGMRKAAGTSVFCGELANELASLGHCVAVATVNGLCEYELDSRVEVRRIDSIMDISDATWDVVHIHGLWTPILHRVSNWAHHNGFKVVWSPHGMLTMWALKNRWWKKLMALALYQYGDLRKADLIHVTAQSEVDDVHRLGLKNKIVVAPLGMRLPMRQPHQMNSRGIRTLLFVSRIQRKKGLTNLIEAWNRLRPSGWRVVIAGPDEEGHIAELNNQMKGTQAERDFQFIGPVFGEEKDHLYQKADLFVLPTHSENFGVVVIEALANGLPVITTKGAPWEELKTQRCGWWIDVGVESLADALRDATVLSDADRIAMGERGRELVRKRYTWTSVAEKMREGYGIII